MLHQQQYSLAGHAQDSHGVGSAGDAAHITLGKYHEIAFVGLAQLEQTIKQLVIQIITRCGRRIEQYRIDPAIQRDAPQGFGLPAECIYRNIRADA